MAKSLAYSPLGAVVSLLANTNETHYLLIAALPIKGNSSSFRQSKDAKLCLKCTKIRLAAGL